MSTTKLYYREYGRESGVKAAPPLVLLHGLCAGSSTWAQVAELLSEKRRVIAPDLLGFGRSPWPDINYTIDDHLDALEDLFKDLNFFDAPFDIAGHSMGGILAVEFAARHGEIIRGVTLVSFPYFRSAEEVGSVASSLGLLERILVKGHWSARLTCGIMCAFRPVLKTVSPYFVPDLPAEVVRDVFQHNFVSYSGSLQNVLTNHRSDAALSSNIGRPILFLHGESDRASPLVNVQQLMKMSPQWRLEIVPDVGHYLPFEKPEAVANFFDASMIGN